MSIGRTRRRFAAGVLAAGGLLLLGGAAVLLAAPDAPPWKAPARAAKKANPVPADADSIAAGKALYVKNCLSCHGDLGKGDGPAAKDLKKSPGDLSQPSMWEQTDGALFWKLTEGNAPMPSFEKTTSETERWQIINYIRTLSPKPASSK